MSSSGGTQPPGANAPLDYFWRPDDELRQTEIDMCAAVKAGELFNLEEELPEPVQGRPDPGTGLPALTEMQAWGSERTIRAAVLKHLLTEGDQVHARGVWLRGVRVIGPLEMEGCSLLCALRLERCYFSSPQLIELYRASASWLTLTGCYLPGLSGNRLVVTKDLDLTGSVFAGPVALEAADIAGNCDFTGAHLDGAGPDGNALYADGIKVGGRLRLNGAFTAAHPVWLRGAHIGANLNCRDARLNGAGNALYGDALKVGGDAFLERMVITGGAFDLRSADIVGHLDFTGAHLDGAGPDGNALYADGIKVGGRLRLNGAFTAAHPVWLRGAHIGANLNCRDAHLNGAGNALYGDALKVGGDAFLERIVIDNGAINLLRAGIAGTLQCGGAHLNGADGGGNALYAQGITVGGDMRLSQEFSANGAIYLLDADVAGTLDCRGAQVNAANTDGNALYAERMKVGRDVFLDISTGQAAFTAQGTLWLNLAQIGGQLSLRGARLVPPKGRYALYAERMRIGGDALLDTFGDISRFVATGPIWLTNADIAGSISCAGAWLTIPNRDGNALCAEGMKVGGNVLLNNGFTAAGALHLADANITMNLDGTGARLEDSNDDLVALYGGGMKVGGGMVLAAAFAAGAVDVRGASIAANLNLSGARLHGTSDLGALVADATKIGGHLLLYGGFTANGAIYLLDAVIAGTLNCRGAQLNGVNGDGDTMYGERMKVAGDVFLDSAMSPEGERSRFTAVGTICLPSADITGNLDFGGAQLNDAGAQDYALNADGIKVGADLKLADGFTATGIIWLNGANISGTLQWTPASQAEGQVNLANAKAGQLEDDWTRAHGCWPTGGLLHLEGFTYGSLSGDNPGDVRQRLGWIRSQWPAYNLPKPVVIDVMAVPPRAPEVTDRRFFTQPYEQLASVYQQAGQDADARMIAVARRRDLRRYGTLTWYRRALNRLLDTTIQYGYQTWRAVLALAVIYGAAVLIFAIAQHQPNLIVPVMDTTNMRPVPTAMNCTIHYPCFYPVGYAIDTVIPLIDVHQASYWAPNAAAPGGPTLVVFTWVGTALGWALVTLAVAGYTGLVRNSDNL